jgi:hypothetical protein
LDPTAPLEPRPVKFFSGEWLKLTDTDIKDNGKEIIIKLKRKNKLSEMLNEINEKNIHDEIETNGPVGNEIW